MAVWVLVDHCFVFKDNMSSTMRMNCIQLRLADGTRCIKRYIPLQSGPCTVKTQYPCKRAAPEAAKNQNRGQHYA